MTNVGDTGFSFTAGRTQAISCSVFLNEEVTLYEPLHLVGKRRQPAVTQSTTTWDIDKSVDKSDHNVPDGTSVDLNYTLNVTQEARTMTSGSVSGAITITNPNDRPMVATVSDTLASEAISARSRGSPTLILPRPEFKSRWRQVAPAITTTAVRSRPSRPWQPTRIR